MALYKGWNAKLLIGTTEIGYCESASVDIALGTEAHWGLGSAIADDVVAGNIEITGTIDRPWVDSELLELMSGAPTLSEFTLKISIQDTAGVLTVTGCRPETVSFDVPQDGFLTHSFDFIGKGFSIVSPS